MEKRKVERSNNILIVSFRQFRESHEYFSGITNNYSNQGINMQTGHVEHKPGEVLELILKHPYSELSVETEGEIVWIADGWYQRTTGIKFKNMDHEADNKLKGLMSKTINAETGQENK
ncbi:MAG: PilZ domain-containing protein [Nitrospirae bacterium]|nr:PilZ domain-containing protein [Nitrospirota bacterium]